MKPMTIQDVCRTVAGRPLTVFPENFPLLDTVSTDSRKMAPGSLFIAIKGDTHDGHRFLEGAARNGAIAALIEDAPANPVPGIALIQVADTRKAMGKLAAHARRQLRGKVIGVAGSNGKTGTKHLIGAALGERLRGSISPGSFNNDIGVPLTIFPAEPAQDFLVLELGTNHPGEIQNLTHIAQPDIAVITNCSAEHMEFLIDLPTVRRENASIVASMDPTTGVLIVNGDDPELLEAVSHWKGRRITFGLEPTNDLFATAIETDQSGVRFFVNGNEKSEFFIPLLGRHIACNALAAIAVARRLGLNESEILAGLAQAKGPGKRLELQHLDRGVTLLNDSYNANPASMRAALETLAQFSGARRRIAILGDMLELGALSKSAHRDAGEQATAARPDALICIGPQAKWIAQAAIASGMNAERVSLFEDWESAARVIPDWLREGDLVLLKASHSMHLDQLGETIGRRLQIQMTSA